MKSKKTNLDLNLVEPGEQLAEMRQNLSNARKALETDKYRQARPKDVAAFLKQAETYTGYAADLFERNPELSGDASIAFDACLWVAFRDMQLALRDPAVVKGTVAWENQVKGGDATADILWPESDSGLPRGEALNEIVRRLLRNRPEEPYADLYGDFCSEFEASGLKKPPGQKRFSDIASAVRKTLPR